LLQGFGEVIRALPLRIFIAICDLLCLAVVFGPTVVFKLLNWRGPGIGARPRARLVCLWGKADAGVVGP
jgi:hypothetical protein